MTIKQPTKRQRIGYWLFVTGLSVSMLYIILIRPIMNSSASNHDKWQYGLIVGGATISGLIGAFLLEKKINKDLKPQHELLDDITEAAKEDMISHPQYMNLIKGLPLGKTKKYHVEKVRKQLETYLKKGKKK